MSVQAGSNAGQQAGTDGGAGQGQQQGGDQTGQPGAEQGGQGNLTGLLDDEANQGGDEGTDGGDPAGNPSGGQQGEQPLTPDAVARIVESTFDRRINAVLREVRGQGQQQQGQQGQQQGQQQPPAQQPPQTSGPVVDPADVRDARAAYRDYVGDSIRFLSPEERGLASTIAQGLIASTIQPGSDPDAVGRDVAKQVSDQIKTIRKSYEERTVSALRRRGLLPAQGGAQQPPPGSGTPGAASNFAAGQAKAAQLFPDRVNPQQ